MALILNIDTSTDVCSVAIARDGNVIALKENDEGFNHSTLLGVYVDDLLKENNLTANDLDAVAVSMGPGSYTGLRIGLSEAKGLAYALDVPLIGVDTLQLMAVSVMFNQMSENPDIMFAPMIDARRMEVYTGVYNLALEALEAPHPLILDVNSYKEWLDRGEVLFFGNGSEKARTVITHPNARFIPDVAPLAVDMLALSDKAFRENNFLSLAYSVPTYLKEFQATRPKPLF